MGFPGIPPAAPAPCVTEVDRLKARYDPAQADVDAKAAILKDLRLQVEGQRATLNRSDATQIARFNALIARENAAVDAYNGAAALANTLSSQYVDLKNECVPDTRPAP